MAQITLKGNTINTIGSLPAIGADAENFELIKTNLSIATLAHFKGQQLILNIFPSVDTDTCAASVRNFNKEVTHFENTKVLCISRDLPFAQSRFCGAEGIDNVIMLSDFKTGDFGKNYNLEITNGPLAGLNSRCIIIIGANGKIKYTEQVTEIIEEPNYKEALANI